LNSSPELYNALFQGNAKIEPHWNCMV